jgi:DNA-binding SARP family transcriptional activator/TolB-like protein
MGADDLYAMLHISVLGSMRVRFQGRDLRLKSRKSGAVLAYLALSEAGLETRERLVGLLWSETEEEKARASLRQIVHELRAAQLEAGFGGLEANRLELRLVPGSVTVDLWEVLRSAERHEPHALILDSPRMAETLLKDFDDIDPAFRVWLLAKRQTVHDRLLRNLEAGLRSVAVAPRVRRQLAEATLSLDPTHEEACRALMQSRAEGGDVAGALRAYSTLWTVLGDEYDMEPSAATQHLVAEIKQGRYDTPDRGSAEPIVTERRTERRADRRAARPDQAVLAVPVARAEFHASVPVPASRPTKMALIVENFGLNGIGADRTHLVMGFRHHLIACLTRFREWYVSDGSSRPASGAGRSAVSTHYAIDATAYKAGDTINLVLTLRERDADIYVWSERFVLELDSWFEAQQRIVRRIAMSLNVQISIERLMRLAGEPDVSLEIYDRWLRGQGMITRFSPDDWSRAAQIFREAIRDAPDFSLAYSSLAGMNTVVHIVHPGTLRDPDKASETLDLARRAVALDPIDSRAQLCMGWAFAMAKHYELAALHMDLACELNPYDSWTLISAALFHAFSGDFEKACDLAGQSLGMTFTPSLAHWGYQVSILFLSGDYRGAIHACDRAQDVLHTLPAWRAASLYHLGRREEAIRDAERFLAGIRGRWFGPSPPSEEAIGRWLLHLYPISKPEPWERLRAGLAGAGIPATGISHHAW